MRGMLDLDSFLEKYDIAGSVVLLAGSRNVAFADQQKLIDLGKLLAKRSKHIVFRSGNAEGADGLFISGVGAIDPKRVEIIIPYSTHRPANRVGYDSFSLDRVDLVNEPTLVYQAKKHKGSQDGIDQYLNGETTGKTVAKAKYILRSTLMVTGSEDVKPANFAIFYVDRKATKPGGTGHTINVCNQMKVEHAEQETWLLWLD